MQSKIPKNTLVNNLKRFTKFFTVAVLLGEGVYGISTVLPTTPLKAQAAFPTSRDPYQWPFSRDSIWNMPIGSNAQYATAGMPAPDTYAADPHNIYRLQNPKSTQFENGVLPLDDGMISDINPNDTTNRVATVIDSNGDFYQIQPGRRNSPTSNVTGYVRDQAAELYPGQLDAEGRRCVKQVAGACYLNIKGKGIDGSHWGSGLSAIGGGLKSGDLTSTEDIRHALNIEVSGWKYLKCNDGDTNFSDFKAKGFMWPADRNDSYACPGGYGGNLDYFRMGALLALKPDLDINSLGLQTDAAKKMAKAFQDYGGYVTDDSYGVNSNSTIFNFTYEKEVASEFKAKYGHDFNIYWDTGSLRQSPFFKDMDKIITQLNVITNNTPTNIGGGGTPRQQLAPCFVGEVGCVNTPVSSSSPTVSSVTSSSTTTSSCTPTSMVRVMPMGDSITEESNASNSYRAKEWVNLNNAGLTNKFTFVGVPGGRADSSPQVVGMPTGHVGYGGYATKNFVDTAPDWGWDGSWNNNPMQVLSGIKPDIAQIMLGTNDQWRNMTNAQSLSYYSQIIDNLRSTKPDIKFLLAVPPVSASNFETEVINPLIAQKQSATSQIVKTNFSGYSTGSDTTDGVHNNSSGADKMGVSFATALKPIIDSLLNCTTVVSSSAASSVTSSTASFISSSTPVSSCPINANQTKITSNNFFGGTPSYGDNPAVIYDKAFDSNIATYYDYANADGGYTGIDINTAPKAVSQICFYPRSGVDGNNIPLTPRVNGGKFQGSNDNSNFQDLATISGVSTTQWYSLPITNTTSFKYLRYLSPNGSYGNIAEVEFYTGTNSTSSSSVTMSSSSMSNQVPGFLALKLILQGAYLADTSSMRTNLKANNLIPLTSPYPESPITATSIPAGTVDWVLIDFRNTSGVSIAKKSGLLKSDGSFVDSDGTNFKLPSAVITGSYNIVIKHRNHLSIATNTPIAITNSNGTVNNLDLTTNINVKGSNQAALSSGKYGLKFGNANSDNSISSKDRIRVRLAGDRLNTYSSEDINMDGNLSSTDRVLSRLNYDYLESI